MFYTHIQFVTSVLHLLILFIIFIITFRNSSDIQKAAYVRTLTSYTTLLGNTVCIILSQEGLMNDLKMALYYILQLERKVEVILISFPAMLKLLRVFRNVKSPCLHIFSPGAVHFYISSQLVNSHTSSVKYILINWTMSL